MARVGLPFALRAPLLSWLEGNISTDWVGKGCMKVVLAGTRMSSLSMTAREAF